MHHFNVHKYKSCVAALTKGASTCGTELLTWENNETTSYMTAGIYFYAGNFWWARCEYINKLPDINELREYDRRMSELWIGMTEEGCMLSCFTLGAQVTNFHTQSIDFELYGDSVGCDWALDFKLRL